MLIFVVFDEQDKRGRMRDPAHEIIIGLELIHGVGGRIHVAGWFWRAKYTRFEPGGIEPLRARHRLTREAETYLPRKGNGRMENGLGFDWDPVHVSVRIW